MENPASWGIHERLINDAHREHAKAMSEGRVGLSLAATAANSLRDAGLLKGQYTDDNVRRLITYFRVLHERVDSGIPYDDNEPDETSTIMFCALCGVPAPCPSQIIIDDIEEYIL